MENVKKTISKMHKIAEIVFDQDLELIDTYIDENVECTNPGVWYLGKSIIKMADADYFICFDTTFVNTTFRGCEIEKEIAAAYDIPSCYITDKVIEMCILKDAHIGHLEESINRMYKENPEIFTKKIMDGLEEEE